MLWARHNLGVVKSIAIGCMWTDAVLVTARCIGLPALLEPVHSDGAACFRLLEGTSRARICRSVLGCGFGEWLAAEAPRINQRRKQSKEGGALPSHIANRGRHGGTAPMPAADKGVPDPHCAQGVTTKNPADPRVPSSVAKFPPLRTCIRRAEGGGEEQGRWERTRGFNAYPTSSSRAIVKPQLG